jgi:hypothetical protein
VARGATFLDLKTRVKALTGRHQSVAVGVDDIPKVEEAINTVYSALYLEHDWPHLRRVFDRVPLQSGQRYYDLPDGLNVERVESACVWWGLKNTPLDRGITAEHYNAYDSVNDDRVEPACRWDVRWTGDSDQLEIWPVPNTNEQELELVGIQDAPRLVADIDVCLLDDTLIVSYAAVMLSKDKDESEKILQFGQGHLATLHSRTRGGDTGLRLGLGHTDRARKNVEIHVRG